MVHQWKHGDHACNVPSAPSDSNDGNYVHYDCLVEIAKNQFLVVIYRQYKLEYQTLISANMATLG